MGVFVTKPTQPYNDCFHHRFFPQVALRYFMLTKKKNLKLKGKFLRKVGKEKPFCYTHNCKLKKTLLIPSNDG